MSVNGAACEQIDLEQCDVKAEVHLNSPVNISCRRISFLKPLMCLWGQRERDGKKLLKRGAGLENHI